jgi:hypothetical protein
MRWPARVAALALVSISFAQQNQGIRGGGYYIGPGELPQALGLSLRAMGGRMVDAPVSQITISGAITDEKGTRPAQIAIQAPGYLCYREATARAVTFDRTKFRSKAGELTVDDDRVAESLLAHFPDAVMLQIAAGGGIRRLGSHFRAQGGEAKDYAGPYWTVFAFAPAERPGLSRGKALQQRLTVCLDEATGFIAAVRTATGDSGQQTITETQFNGWQQQGGQWFPGQIVRLENGKRVLSFQVQQAVAGPGSAIEAFRP